jgi:predicted transcriptional regulator of viral defense system
MLFNRGDLMNRIEKINRIRRIFEANGNIMKTSELSAAKIYYKDIQDLLNEGIIDKLKQGFYYLVDDDDLSEIRIIKRLYPDAIICLNSALYYHGYSDRTPLEWHLAVNKDISKYKLKIDYPFVKIYMLEKHLLEIGLSEIEIDGNKARIFDKERTICDCLRYIGKMDKEIFNKAIQYYIRDPKKNIPNLMKYAKQLRVEKKVKDLIGVWL